MVAIHLLRLGVLLGATLLGSAQAASLRDVLEQAWAVQADQQGARDRQYAAQVAASQAWTPQPPSLGLFNTTDQFNGDYGRREWEVGIAAPIWLPGQRDQAQAVANAEKTAFNGRNELGRWQLAGQLRESWWTVRFAEVDLASANRQLAEAQALAKDVSQRVKAGELAALDENQAKIAVAQAKRQQDLAGLELQRSRTTFALLSNGASLPAQAEVLAPAPALEQHPLLSSLHAAVRSAQARLDQATGDSRDAPELALTYTSERDAAADPYRDRIKLGITIPFGSESRNRPRIEAANADWIEAQTSQDVERRRIAAEISAAQLELSQSQQLQALAAEELTLVKQRSAWIEQGFRLGQFDLLTQLRSQREQLDAQAQVERAEYAVGRAISRFNQAAGVLP
ncbi:TolC family protein [Pseudomonas sp. N040]|uniref:TolC family protein n=1 Tax=Pseudomonas sp. N040 TaxID=2785325 RepID=UPI0018A2E9C3|nr:TolC family protein [Pseudomonas sp. N040]MBF7731702.1 TolC family protein [Pseudomonas sp. N040]MBW7015346.1 TolC family protein [Pseudomonas sp. N040]